MLIYRYDPENSKLWIIAKENATSCNIKIYLDKIDQMTIGNELLMNINEFEDPFYMTTFNIGDMKQLK